MNLLFFLSVVLVLSISCVGISARVSKGLKSSKDYFLANRGLGVFSLALSVMATQLGGGSILGACDEAYRVGWGAMLWSLGYAVGLLLLGLGLGARLRQAEVTTLAELFEKRYGSRRLRRVASALSVISLFFIMVANLIACRKLLYTFGLESNLIFSAIWLCVLVYTAMGGLKAVVYTDVLQTLAIAAIFGLAFGLAVWSAPPIEPGIVEAAVGEAGGLSLFASLFLMPLLFMIIGQDMGQRCFSGKSQKVVSRAFLLSFVGVILIGAIPVFFGNLARQMGVEVPEGSCVLVETVGRVSGPIMAALAGCAILVAILSTVDSLLCAISSNVASDFSNRMTLRWCQLTTVLVGVGAIGFSFTCRSVALVMMQSYELSVSCLAVPILAAIFGISGTARSIWAAILCGLGGFLLFRWITIPIPRELISLGLSALGYSFGQWSLRVVKRVSAQNGMAGDLLDEAR
jgi:solute:Na+ symporter, SSS family